MERSKEIMLKRRQIRLRVITLQRSVEKRQILKKNDNKIQP